MSSTAESEAAASPEPAPEPKPDAGVTEGDGSSAPSEAALSEPPPPPIQLKRKSRGRGLLKHLTELPMLVLIAFGIAIIIKTFLVQAFFIPSASMKPTLVEGDRVLVEKVSYALHDQRRGDVVVFEKSAFGRARDLPWYEDGRNFLRELLGLPTGREEDYIKRVVALPGDKIRYVGSPRRLLINGEKVDQRFVKGGKDKISSTITGADCKRLEMSRAGNGCRIPAGKIFVMGDNRANSEDSRILGPIDQDKVIGRAFVIIWPPGDFRSL